MDTWILTSAAKNTVVFTILGFAGGLSFGLLFALMRLSTIRPYRWLAATYIEIFRGIPLLVTLLALGFGIPIATGCVFGERQTEIDTGTIQSIFRKN